jgi:hypothetical protein
MRERERGGGNKITKGIGLDMTEMKKKKRRKR